MGGFYYFNITKIINPDDAKTYSFSLTCNFVTSTDVVNDTISFPNSLTFQPLPFDICSASANPNMVYRHATLSYTVKLSSSIPANGFIYLNYPSYWPSDPRG